jgi:hypothetical protein
MAGEKLAECFCVLLKWQDVPSGTSQKTQDITHNRQNLRAGQRSGPNEAARRIYAWPPQFRLSLIANAPGCVAKDPEAFMAKACDMDALKRALSGLNADALFEDKKPVSLNVKHSSTVVYEYRLPLVGNLLADLWNPSIFKNQDPVYLICSSQRGCNST